MPSIETQTYEPYTVVDNLDDTEVLNTMRQFTSKYTGEDIYVFIKYCKSSSNDKSTMTSYNSKNVFYMDMYIQQIIDSGD